MRSVLDKVVQTERYVCAVLLIIMTLITFVQVVFRFIFVAPFSWSEEMTLMFLVWFGYLCMPIDIYTDSHAAIFAFYNKMPGAVRKCLDILRHGLLLWFFIELAHYGIQLSNLYAKQTQPASRLSYGWLYYPLVVGGILMSIYCVFNLFKTLTTKTSEYKKIGGKEDTFDTQIKRKVEERGGVL